MHEKLEPGDVVEITSNEQRWAVGCLLVVDGVYDWGVSGYILKPVFAHRGPIKHFHSATYDQVYRIGKIKSTS